MSRRRPTDRAAEVRAARGPKASLDPLRPSAMMVESELDRDRCWEPVRTLFLTGAECPLTCTMCDLWRYTLDVPTAVGAIPAQIDAAHRELPPAPHIKLYNAGNFFDPRAIPVADLDPIFERTRDYRTVIVENHPSFCVERCLAFARRCEGRLEVAIGLETIDPLALAWLDKRASLDQVAAAIDRLLEATATVRAFVLLQPPGHADGDSVEWSARTVEWAWRRGVDCCAVIPVRGGNGWLDREAAAGRWSPPTLAQLEQVLDAVPTGFDRRLQLDLWDVERLVGCDICRTARIARIEAFHRTQVVSEPVRCSVCSPP
ncbi:MAG TPA: radical SAM protein [Planctomycetaceae bacterium]|nr:radical SAM protein [Planctomycetaceae bacterium]